MSDSNEKDLGLDLDLHFLPAWAQQSSAINKYSQHQGERGDRQRTPARPGLKRREEGGRPDRAGRPPRGKPQRHERHERPERARTEEPRREAPPLPGVKVSFLPDIRGVESLARQIRMTGRAYPLFEIAFMILKKPERHHVRFDCVKPSADEPEPLLYVCALDETLWPSEGEVVQHVLEHHFSTFYQTDRTPGEPPKGTYTFVAQCGMSGAILGPPNYHDYQNKLRKLHQDRFSRVPFEVFKSRVKIVRDEATVKRWIEDQSWKTEYICLNVPETVKLSTREEVEAHFRQTHLANVIKAVNSHTLTGVASRDTRSPRLQSLVRQSWEEQMRFPLQVVNVLSRQFASHGLHFFKVNRTVTHVAVARPRFLDMEATPVSENIRRIVEFINQHPKCTRRDLIQAWSPASPPAEALPQARRESTASKEPAASPGEVAPIEPSPEVAAMIADLHWLVHEGHVMEFANGHLDVAKMPAPRPVKPHSEPSASAPAPSPSEPPPLPGLEENEGAEGFALASPGQGTSAGLATPEGMASSAVAEESAPQDHGGLAVPEAPEEGPMPAETLSPPDVAPPTKDPAAETEIPAEPEPITPQPTL